MTTPAQQPAVQPQPTQRVVVSPFNVNGFRAVVSVFETAAFVGASVLALMDNGQDFKHAVVAALIGFIAHGVNHNAGGSPV